MKIAGQKNPGAWNRMNKFLASLQAADQTNVISKVAALPTIDAAFNAYTALAAETGLSGLPGQPQSSAAYAAQIVQKGIPLQTWMGKLTFSTYSKGVGNVLRQNYASPIHYFAKDLRKLMKSLKAADRELRDVFDLGTAKQNNPGGNPDGPYTSRPTGT